MAEKLQILYPRTGIKIRVEDFSKQFAAIDKEIKEIKKSEIFKRYNNLIDLKILLEKQKSYFCCWNCGVEEQTSNLTLYNFISYSSGPDENIYEDRNVICPSCGKFSTVDNKVKCGFKELKEIHK